MLQTHLGGIMKKLIIALLVSSFSFSVMADGHADWWKKAGAPYKGVTLQGITENTPPGNFAADVLAKDFEEFVQKRFFDYSNNIGNNFVYEICVEDTKLCDGLNKTYSNAPYWPITLSELNSLSKDLKDAYTILEEIVSLNKTIDETRKKTKGRKNYINDNNSMSPKRIEQKLLINKLFFKLGHAAALSRSSNQQLWYTLFTQNIVMKEYEIAKIKLINRIHAANSFHDDDLFDEEEEEED